MTSSVSHNCPVCGKAPAPESNLVYDDLSKMDVCAPCRGSMNEARRNFSKWGIKYGPSFD